MLMTIFCSLQVDYLFSFCHKLGLSSVVLVGHDDGGLLALMAAEKAQTSMDTCQVVSTAFSLHCFL
jgi:pimeloyl-ACP methyl ester carboxylesterase